jgi:glyoxalase family protein
MPLGEQPPRFGEESVLVSDPSGLAIELVATSRDRRIPWAGNGVTTDAAVRGLHSVTLQSRAPGLTRSLLTGLLGFNQVNEGGGRVRLGIGGDEAGRVVDIVDPSGASAARNGLGTVHHVAFAISDEAEQLRLRDELIGQGLAVTEVLDRCYFRSIYFREPGGILFEVATTKPGFTVDENASSLGSALKLPPWEERNRASIEQVLRPAGIRAGRLLSGEHISERT